MDVIALDRAQYLDALRRDGAAFASSARAAGLTTPVASCPGWTVADLVWHLAEVHYFWGSVVHQRAAGGAEVINLHRPTDDANLFALYNMQFERLLQVLGEADPATEVWTWSEQHNVAFVLRRMAQETAVHRWDADAAAGRPAPIEAVLASDGIDEFLTHFVDDVARNAQPLGGSVHIHCTDVAGEWTIHQMMLADVDVPALPAGFDVAREHAKGDCALRGPASDLLLALWRRTPIASIDAIGDTAVGARFLASTNLT
ncbi:unannotated protein [freshwater metagenome]|uniref:Unannotated protein n=1 Tax=freshwater metagenome TaxID=449393 RepID=A0A6J7EFT9_9ZZZZ